MSYFGGFLENESRGEDAQLQLWQGELDFVEQLLQDDARNNSAWNHRFFCIFSSGFAKNGDTNAKAQELCLGQWKLGKSFGECIEHEIE